MTTKRYILAFLILSLCTGVQAQNVYEAEMEAQLQVSEAWMRLAESEARYAETWVELRRAEYAKDADYTEDHADRMRKLAIFMARPNAENIEPEVQRMDGEAESLRRLARDYRMWLDDEQRLQHIDHMAANLEQAAALYRRAQMQYLDLITEFEH